MSCTQSPAAQLKTGLQQVASWTATARMAGEAWLKGSVPQAYAAQTLRAAQETLQEEAKALEEALPNSAAAELHASLLKQARSIAGVIGQMRAAVEKRDRQTLSHLLKQLEAEQQALHALSKRGGAEL